MNSLVTEFWPYLMLLLIGFLPNEIWRLLAPGLSHGVNEGSEILVWVGAVATAVLAGVIGKLILFPAGALTTVPMAVRIAAAGLGLLAFFAIRRSVFAGVVAGEAALIAGALWFSP